MSRAVNRLAALMAQPWAMKRTRVCRAWCTAVVDFLSVWEIDPTLHAHTTAAISRLVYPAFFQVKLSTLAKRRSWSDGEIIQAELSFTGTFPMAGSHRLTFKLRSGLSWGSTFEALGGFRGHVNIPFLINRIKFPPPRKKNSSYTQTWSSERFIPHALGLARFCK